MIASPTTGRQPLESYQNRSGGREGGGGGGGGGGREGRREGGAMANTYPPSTPFSQNSFRRAASPVESTSAIDGVFLLGTPSLPSLHPFLPCWRLTLPPFLPPSLPRSP